MATQLFFRRSDDTNRAAPDEFSFGTNLTKLDGTASGWVTNGSFRTTRGDIMVSLSGVPTVDGPTSGVEVNLGPTSPYHFVSPPIDADVTISGTITLNIWAAESSMFANVAINAIIERVGPTGAILSTIAQTARTTEVAVTTRAVNNFTVTPTSTAMQKGDRIRVRIYGADAGTMVVGHTFDVSASGPTAAADGDTYVTFTETFGLLTTDPTGTQLFLTSAASAVDIGASVDEYEAWTARGSGVVSKSTSSVLGWVAPIQWEAADANVIEWYSKQLQAFTLTAPVLANIRARETNAVDNVALRVEVAITNSDGSGATVWAATTYVNELGTTEAADVWYIAGDDLAVTDGQRIRVRVFLDDASEAPMAVRSLGSILYYAGTSAGASGDSYITLGQSVSEFSAGVTVPFNPIPFYTPKGRSL